jgi:hypothetical protein
LAKTPVLPGIEPNTQVHFCFVRGLSHALIIAHACLHCNACISSPETPA